MIEGLIQADGKTQTADGNEFLPLCILEICDSAPSRKSLELSQPLDGVLIYLMIHRGNIISD